MWSFPFSIWLYATLRPKQSVSVETKRSPVIKALSLLVLIPPFLIRPSPVQTKISSSTRYLSSVMRKQRTWRGCMSSASYHDKTCCPHLLQCPVRTDRCGRSYWTMYVGHRLSTNRQLFIEIWTHLYISPMITWTRAPLSMCTSQWHKQSGQNIVTISWRWTVEIASWQHQVSLGGNSRRNSVLLFQCCLLRSSSIVKQY